MSEPVSQTPTMMSDSQSPLARAVASVLSELIDVLGPITPGAYAASCGSQFFDASIGGHVRHCLDHARALVDGRVGGVIDYDHRERGTVIESDPTAAMLEIRSLTISLLAIAPHDEQTKVAVHIMPTRSGDTVRVESTLGRELAFVLSHTVHHNATVRSMAHALGISVPASFGFAPSTLANQDSASCAR